MSEMVAPATSGNGFLQRADRALLSYSKTYLAIAILAIQSLLIYGDHLTGPWVPFGVFYLLSLFVAVKYLRGRTAYVMAFVIAFAKTYVHSKSIPAEVLWWQILWQFLSSYSIYTLFCYLINSQLSARMRAEDALDKLVRLNEAIVTHADSGIMVFRDDGKCIVANEAAARILDCPLDQIRHYDLTMDNTWHVPALLETCREMMHSGIAKKFAVHLKEAPAKDVWCAVSIGRVERASKNYILLMFTDISDFKAAEEARRQADKITAFAVNRASDAERKLISISEETQQRIGRELHDDLGQHLTGIAFMAQVLSQKLRDAGHIEITDAEKITLMLNQAIAKTRHLAHGLYPAELEEHSLCGKLEKFADHVEAIYHVECEFSADESWLIEEQEVATHLFRITQEAVNNAVKHGHATRIILRMSHLPSSQVLEILDNGCGLDVQATATGLGMRSMRYRADLIGAALDISARPEGGTQVIIRMPVKQ